MPIEGVARRIKSSIAHRWRALLPRGGVALALLAAGIVIVGGSIVSLMTDSWKARTTLKASGDTWPLAFSPDSRTYLSSGFECIDRWDAATGQKVGEPWSIPSGQYAMFGAFSPDGRTFAAVAFGPRPIPAYTIHLIDTATGRIRASFPFDCPSFSGLKFTDDGRTLHAFLNVGLNFKRLATWDATLGRQLSDQPLRAPTTDGMEAVSDDGRTLAFVTKDKSNVQVWDLEADRSLGSVTIPGATAAVIWRAVDLSPDGRTLVAANDDGTVVVWDLPARTIRATWKVHSIRYITGLILSPNGRTVALEAYPTQGNSTVAWVLRFLRRLFGEDGIPPPDVIVLDIASGQKRGRATQSSRPRYSPDGRTLATRERDQSIKLRDVPGSN